MNKKAFYGILLGLVVPLVAFFVMDLVRNDAMPQRLFYDDVKTSVVNGKKQSDTVWSKVPGFTLKNQLGRDVSLEDAKGKIIVANFFFTRCPTICPTLMRNMKRLQDAVKKSGRAGNLEADYVQFISFTVDPGHDSVPVLKAYADKNQINPNNWWLLTGNKNEIYNLALEGMKLGITETEIDSNFIHPQQFVLIDKDRVVRARKDEMGNPKLYNGLDSAHVKLIAEDIILLTLEKDKKKKFFLADKLPLVGIVLALAVLGLSVMFYLLKRNKSK